MTEEQVPYDLPPRAGAMIEALRDIGYSLESAVADIIDNALTASATAIELRFGWLGGEPWIAIVNNGVGLTSKELREAMRLGARDPREVRDREDLGRFSLGMKTASFSQCRQLTVVSEKNGARSGACWDLDIVRQRDDWGLLPVTGAEMAALPGIEGLSGQGTGILWRKIDRLDLDGDNDRSRRILNARMDSVRRHLSLVFHRFLEGDPRRPRVAMAINGNPVEAFDPFNARNTATSHMLDEKVTIGDETVSIQPYILPHHSKVSPQEYERLAGEEGYLRNQGFYVYRNRRLINWGTWFRLAKQEELTKLARVKVDIPNTLDQLWTIDVRKSRANPPHAIRERMRQVVDRIRQSAKRPYTHRGTLVMERQKTVKQVWVRRVFNERNAYEIDLSHPLVEDLRMDLEADTRSRLDAVLKLVGSSFPAALFFSDMGTDPKKTEPVAPDDEFLIVLARMMRDACTAENETDFRARLLLVEPFASLPERMDRIIAQLEEDT
ncbi:MAG: ATP-binding protein [Chromatiales bacterium]|nr:ATP-binding protein [Chromatiales bacterium]